MRKPDRRRRPLHRRPAPGPLSHLSAILLCLLVGCSVPDQPVATSIPSADIPSGVLSEPQPRAASSIGAGGPRVYFLDRAGRLSPTTLAHTGTADEAVSQILAALAEGPSTADSARGLHSAVGADIPLRLAGPVGENVRVQWGPVSTSAPVERATVAAAQIVLSITSVPGLTTVQFVDGGEPLPTGELVTRPLSPSDFASLPSN